MYPPPYVPDLPVVTPPEPLPRCPCGFALPHASACSFSLDPEAT